MSYFYLAKEIADEINLLITENNDENKSDSKNKSDNHYVEYYDYCDIYLLIPEILKLLEGSFIYEIRDPHYKRTRVIITYKLKLLQLEFDNYSNIYIIKITYK